MRGPGAAGVPRTRWSYDLPAMDVLRRPEWAGSPIELGELFVVTKDKRKSHCVLRTSQSVMAQGRLGRGKDREHAAPMPHGRRYTAVVSIGASPELRLVITTRRRASVSSDQTSRRSAHIPVSARCAV